MYSLHDIRVEGLPVKEVLECEIESAIGEHSTLTLQGYADGAQTLYMLPDCQEIAVYAGEEKNALFFGIVTKIRLQESGGLQIVRIEAKSQSWLMDREKRSRSFQNTKMTFAELAEEILAGYGDNDACGLILAGESHEIRTLLVQYEETDWAFLKRAFSAAGITLTPDSRQPGLKLYAGIVGAVEEELPCRIVGMEKDMASYYSLKANGRETGAAAFTRYRAVSEKLMGIFGAVAVQGGYLVARSCRYVFQNEELMGIYELQDPLGLVQAASYPMQLIGVALNARVVEASGINIRAMLEIDGEDAQRAAYWFPFSTLSASPDGSGWYCMPEAGDEVRIYFPSKREKDAVALSAVSSDVILPGGKDRMEDPESRYLRTKDGQELALAPEYIRLSCGEDSASVTLRTDGAVTVQALARTQVWALRSMTLCAEEAVSIHAGTGFAAQSTDGGLLVLTEGKAGIMGTQVRFD